MPLRAGIHRVGPDSGMLEVRTYREGLAQKVGHDLIIDVGQWQATVEVREGGVLSSIGLDVDSHSLQVREGLRGVKPLSDKDRTEILRRLMRRSCAGSRSRSGLARSTPVMVG